MNYVFPPPAVSAVPVLGSDLAFPVRRLFCVGRNYVEHAQEMGFTGRESPFFFMKPADCVVVVPEGTTGEIAYPPGTRDLHHEVELVVAIGQGGNDIDAANASRHVFGYAVGLDMTRRDLQAQAKALGRPWEIGKCHDQSAPISPIVPVARADDLANADIALTVNGEPRQASNLARMIWSIGEIIEHLSRYWTLQPGDLIFTGTPEGVSAVQRGDLMVGTIDGVGLLQVRVN